MNRIVLKHILTLLALIFITSNSSKASMKKASALYSNFSEDKELAIDELFLKMCAWDQENYIVGAGTTGKSDKNRTDGMVDNHAYSVISAYNRVADTNIGLFKVRCVFSSRAFLILCIPLLTQNLR